MGIGDPNVMRGRSAMAFAVGVKSAPMAILREWVVVREELEVTDDPGTRLYGGAMAKDAAWSLVRLK